MSETFWMCFLWLSNSPQINGCGGATARTLFEHGFSPHALGVLRRFLCVVHDAMEFVFAMMHGSATPGAWRASPMSRQEHQKVVY